VTLERAGELIRLKHEKMMKAMIRTFPEEPRLSVLNGRWGPYISYKKENYKIPKTVKAEELTVEACMKIISEASAKAKKQNKSR
jgi:DNA topoisomerase-1